MIYGRLTHTMGTCIDDTHPYQFVLRKDMRGVVPMEEMSTLSPNRGHLGSLGLVKGRLEALVHGERGIAMAGDRRSLGGFSFSATTISSLGYSIVRQVGQGVITHPSIGVSDIATALTTKCQTWEVTRTAMVLSLAQSSHCQVEEVSKDL